MMIAHLDRMRQPLLVGLCALIGLIHATSTQQFPFKAHQRYKRQLGSGELDVPNQQIDLNITVPYIFSARLYPYGETKGDLVIHGNSEVYKLANPFHYLGQIYETIYALCGAGGLDKVIEITSAIGSDGGHAAATARNEVIRG
ncbi:hypothetical protein GCK32_013146 [Trichostrongylus colubriformis]|uniref:Uncharacterized protein n=1 Tax=Trichostrongylus colubriformis TaxID=6319 RepID=A0AAN8FJH9_TRICO